MGYAALYPVNGPRPQAPKYGLIPSALVVDTAVEGSGNRWINGVDVWPYPSDIPSAFDACNTAHASPNGKTDGELPDTQQFSAFTVYEAMACTARSVHEFDTYVERVTAALQAGEGWRVEREFWDDSLGLGNPHLSDGNATVLFGGAPTSPTNGLAELEQAIADSGRFGFIHATAATVSVWSAAYQIFQDGPVLRTILGNVVVPGFGYSGTGPDSQAEPDDGQAWAYATGPVDLRRSGIEVVPGELKQAMTMTPATNRITVRAERYYEVDWDVTLQAAILIDRCQTDCSAS